MDTEDFKTAKRARLIAEIVHLQKRNVDLLNKVISLEHSIKSGAALLAPRYPNDCRPDTRFG